MRRFLLTLVFLCLGFLFYREGRKIAGHSTPPPVTIPESQPSESATRLKLPKLPKIAHRQGEDAPRNENAPRTWTAIDGSTFDALVVAADAKVAQMRLLKTQRVQTVKLELLAEKERQKIAKWVHAHGTNGVAGFPIRLKKHQRWPHEWRGKDSISLQQVPHSNLWKSPHFDITNEAGVNRDALESIANICESVDGALNALPLPLPANWGRSLDRRRKIVIERSPQTSGAGFQAGYWDGRTGIVHINVDYLFEHEMQRVVFEFDKPKRRQKYDTIVHEVTHQSTAALGYLGVPAWVPEGIAEYMAAMQQAPSVYYFGNTHVSARYHINKLILGDRIIKERKMHFTFLENLMNRDIREWNAIATSDAVAGRLQYDEALLLIDYFFHYDHPDGLFFRRYLEAILSGLPEEDARSRYLLRGRSYAQLEHELIARWKGLGFAIDFRSRGQLQPEDAIVDWEAEEAKRSMAARRAMMGQ